MADKAPAMLLALDTSGPLCSAALHDGSMLIASRSDDIGRGHAEHLMGMLEDILADQNIVWSDLEKIACATGPGSFTGLRVGLATARGLALALGCPCVGVTVFEAMQREHGYPLAVVMDAKRGQVWMQCFAGMDTEPQAVALEDVVDTIPENIANLSGAAAPLIAQLNNRFTVVSDAPSPSIEAIAQLGVEKPGDGVRPKPLYLRSADAKPQKPALVGH